MKNIREFIHLAEQIVNDLREKIIANEYGLYEAEEKILMFINNFGSILLKNVLTNLPEPTVENTIFVNDKRARYSDTRSVSLKNRFGSISQVKRRSYKIEGGGCYRPLDVKLGIKNCKGFTPLMTYLLSFFGGTEPFESSAKKLSTTIGFKVSGTTVQSNTEKIGEIICHDPLKNIPQEHQNKECELLIAEVDGTMSPQLLQIEGVTGHAVKKQKTEYKQCNVITIEKIYNEVSRERWYGANYGPGYTFEEYARKTGLMMGLMKAKKVVFIADGAKTNWKIQLNYFPDSIGILDFYHAIEHLAAFCEQLKNSKVKKLERWKEMIYEGEIIQVLEEMKQDWLSNRLKNNDEAVTHINYFENNKTRMDYYTYRKEGYPIGSGMVEGACKFIVGKRFKDNGMRWTIKDNKAVLDVRLAILNNQLQDMFRKRAA